LAILKEGPPGVILAGPLPLLGKELAIQIQEGIFNLPKRWASFISKTFRWQFSTPTMELLQPSLEDMPPTHARVDNFVHTRSIILKQLLL